MDSAFEALQSHPNVCSIQWRDDLDIFSHRAGRYGLAIQCRDGERMGVRAQQASKDEMAAILLDWLKSRG